MEGLEGDPEDRPGPAGWIDSGVRVSSTRRWTDKLLDLAQGPKRTYNASLDALTEVVWSSGLLSAIMPKEGASPPRLSSPAPPFARLAMAADAQE